MIETLQAFVLYKTWSGETSARVTFLTRESGVIISTCKGGKKPEIQALLQPFLPLWLLVKKYPSSWFVNSLENAAPPFNLQGSALFSGLYMNELLYHVHKPDSGMNLFDDYLTTVQYLAQAKTGHEIEMHLRRFEWALLRASGYAFSLEEDVQTNLPILPDKQYLFLPEKGLYPASQGISGEHILALSRDELDKPEVLKTAKYLMRQAIDHLLGGIAIHARKLYT